MADLIQDGNIYFEQRRHEILSIDVEYTRDALSVDLLATLGKSEFVEVNSEEVETMVTYIDFIFRKNDVESIFALPRVGDVIKYTANGETLIYEVEKPLGQQAYSVDAYNLSITIHTQLLERE